MISTNIITFEISFINSTETLIINNSLKSLNELVTYLKDKGYTFGQIKEFEKSQSKFKKCALKRFVSCTDHCTELNLMLTKK